jgi:hypothetical protein
MFDAGCCAPCEARNRKRYYALHQLTYHDYYHRHLQEQSSSPTNNNGNNNIGLDNFRLPDFIVAFNTGMHEENTESWKTSVEFMLDMNVPCLFTSYSKSKAEKYYAVLKVLKAHLLRQGPI